MRTMIVRRFMPALLLAFMCLLLSSCSFLGCDNWGCDSHENKTTALAISPATATVKPGDTLQLHANATLENHEQIKLSAGDVRWTVSSGGGSVDEDGLFTAPSSSGTSVVTGTTMHQGSTFSATSTINVVASASPSPSPSGERYAGETKQLFYNGNDAGVDGGGEAPSFTLHDTCVITEIIDYHYTAHGKTPGTIALRGADGTTYGPWPCTGTLGQGGVVNAYWRAKPNVTVPAGKYTIVDSDPASFSQNDWTKGVGIAWVYGAEQ